MTLSMLPQQNHPPLPRHVAIIPDGNRRWASARGLKPWEGHRVGAENTELLIRAARDMGIRELSLWGSSLENLTKRPVLERKALLEIYAEYFGKILQDRDIVEERVRIRCIGRWREQFPSALKRILEAVEVHTREHDRYFLNFFLAYSGVDDMLEAFRGVVGSGVTEAAVTTDLVKSHLMTADLAPVDLLIRTGGEPHLSAGFLMWDIADAQLFFSEAYYPDFHPDLLREAIADYGDRERRYGK